MPHGDAGGVRLCRRSGDKRDVRAAARQRRSNGVALLAGRIIADVAHRIDRFARRAGGDQGGLARQRLHRRRQYRLDTRQDVGRFRHAPGADFAARKVAGRRPDELNTVRRQLRDVALSHRFRPHLDVHGGCSQHGLVGGQQDGGREVVRHAGRHARQNVGGRRRDHDQVALTGQADVSHLAFIGQRQQLLVHLLARQRSNREGGYELRPRLGQDATDARTPLFHAPDQLQRLVGGDAARDDEQDVASR